MSAVREAAASGGGGLSLGAVCVIAFVVLLVFALAALVGPGIRSRRDTERARLDELHRYRLVGAYGAPVGSDEADTPTESEFTRRALTLIDRLLRSRGNRARLVDQLERAGLRMRPEEWAGIVLLAIVGTGVLLAFLIHSIFGVLIGGLIGWGAGRLFLSQKIKRRAAAFEVNLPDALQLLAGALRSGFAVNQSLGAVVREGIEPVASEFGRAMQEVRLGAELIDALDAVAARMRSRDMQLVAMAMRTSREVGGNLAEVLQNTVDTMRERVQLRGQVKVLSAEGRLSAKILTGLPLVMAGYMFVFKRSYLHPMYTTTVGIAMLIGGSVLLAVGSFWLSRITKIEV